MKFLKIISLPLLFSISALLLPDGAIAQEKSKEIMEVNLNNAISECEKGLAASRKAWEKYHDGEAPINPVPKK